MSRNYCSRCAYPEKTCLCHAITEMRSQTSIVVLQHPGESRHAKNTARLVELVIPDTELLVGENEADFADVRERLQMDPHAAVLYPTTGSTSLQESIAGEPIETIILIDGTWRKARKMWFANPWLHALRVCHLNDVGSSAYRIRSSNVSGGLASIEAVAIALNLLGETSVEPLWNAFMAMQGYWPGRV